MLYQQLFSKPVFSYYCSECFTLLHTTADLLPLSCFTERLMYCPECGKPLQQTLTYRRDYTSPPETREIPQKIAADHGRKPLPIFQSASSLLGLRSGVGKIDSTLGGLKESTHLLILGGFSNVLAERLCLRSLLPRDSGGMNTRPIFIDAGNCSDPYLFASFARQYRIEPKQALRQVVTSRAFTVYQLVNLVVEELPKMLRECDSKIVIIADLLRMFDDPQIDRHESERIVEELGRTIQKMRDEEKLLVVSTVPQRNSLAKLLLNRADIALQIEVWKNRSTLVSLLKHPTQNSSSIVIGQNELFGSNEPRRVFREVVAYG